MRFITAVGLVVTIAGCCLSQAAAATNTYPPYRVQLVVYCSESGTQDLVRSYVARELRRLSDVLIVEEVARYDLRVIAVPYQNGSVIALSTVTTSCNDTADILATALTNTPPKVTRLVELLTTNSPVHLDHTAYVTPPSKLDQACARIVARFDTQILEPVRQADRRVREEIEEAIRSKPPAKEK